jgi:hypothetical protein
VCPRKLELYLRPAGRCFFFCIEVQQQVSPGFKPLDTLSFLTRASSNSIFDQPVAIWGGGVKL